MTQWELIKALLTKDLIEAGIAIGLVILILIILYFISGRK